MDCDTSSLPAETIICGYFDHRGNIFRVLGQKLGPQFQLLPCDAPDNIIDDLSVVIISIPIEEGMDPHARFGMLNTVVRQSGAPPVVAFLSSADHDLMRQAISAGAYDVFIETSPLEE